MPWANGPYCAFYPLTKVVRVKPSAMPAAFRAKVAWTGPETVSPIAKLAVAIEVRKLLLDISFPFLRGTAPAVPAATARIGKCQSATEKTKRLDAEAATNREAARSNFLACLSNDLHCSKT
jgi:hypothetical protein